MTAEDRANLEKMLDICDTMKGWMARYDDICIRFYGDTWQDPGLLKRVGDRLLEMGRTAGRFSEAFYAKYGRADWKHLEADIDKRIRPYGQLNENRVWDEMDSCARSWKPYLQELLDEQDENP